MKGKLVGLVVNPIAGMGGRVGLKGTDGNSTLERALELGAKPVAPERTLRFLKALKSESINLTFYTPSGIMGGEYVEKLGFECRVVLEVKPPTTRLDTIRACKKILEYKPELIVFVGGDGTARDVFEAIRDSCPVIGVPSGVKMYSSVFSVTPEAAALLVKRYFENRVSLGLREVLDIDEEAYRRDELRVRLYGYLKVPVDPGLVQSGKETVYTTSEEENKKAIARYFLENLERDVLYILGPGSTVKSIGEALGVEKTILGVDAYYNGEIVGKDLNEEKLEKLVAKFKNRKVKLVLTPIGGQGFILGRGNLQISPKIVREIGLENIIVVATRSKMGKIKCLRVDTGDLVLDSELRGKYLRIIVDYNEEMMCKIC